MMSRPTSDQQQQNQSLENPKPAPHLRPRPAWRRRLLTLVIVYALLEALALLALLTLGAVRGIRYLPIETERLSAATEAELDRVLDGALRYLKHDAELGWSIQAGGTSGLYTANAHGLRGDRDHALTAEPDRVRIAACGDSFTHGDDVALADTWQARLEHCAPAAEVLNFGVPAYGPGQAYLRYRRDGRRFGAQIVLIGMMAENIFRAVNVFRPFYSPRYAFPFTKPRFTVRDGELELLPNPMRTLDDYRQLRADPARHLARIGTHDVFFHRRSRASAADFFPIVRLTRLLGDTMGAASGGVLAADGTYNVDHEAFRVVTGVLKTFHDLVREDGAQPLVVIFPAPILPAGVERPRTYAPLLQWLRERGIAHVDLQDAFDQDADPHKIADLHVGPSRHYAPAANDIVARCLYERLTAEGWLVPPGARGR